MRAGVFKLAKIFACGKAERFDEGAKFLVRRCSDEIEIRALVFIARVDRYAPPPDSVAVIPFASSAWLTIAASSSNVVSLVIRGMTYRGLPLRRGR